jgi:hypothetical protein
MIQDNNILIAYGGNPDNNFKKGKLFSLSGCWIIAYNSQQGVEWGEDRVGTNALQMYWLLHAGPASCPDHHTPTQFTHKCLLGVQMQLKQELPLV